MVRRHHPLSRDERLELDKKFEEPKTKPRSIRGKIKDAIKAKEAEDELFSYTKQRDIEG